MNFNLLKRSFILTALALVAVGCNEYTTRICPSVGPSDFPRFEQEHVVRMYDSANFEATESVVSYTKVADGTYLSSTGFKQVTCVVDGIRIVEAYSENLGTFSLQSIVETENGYESASVGFNKSDLDREKIPYHFEAAQLLTSVTGWVRELKHLGLSRLLPTPQAGPVPQRLIIDNSDPANTSRFVKFAKPMGIQYRLYAK